MTCHFKGHSMTCHWGTFRRILVKSSQKYSMNSTSKGGLMTCHPPVDSMTCRFDDLSF